MSKFLLILSLLWFFPEIDCQDRSVNTIKNIVKDYIDKTNRKSIAKGEYNVFVVKVLKVSECDISVVMSHISNGYELDYINAEYFYKSDSDYILVDANGTTISQENDWQLKPIDAKTKAALLEKLAPDFTLIHSIKKMLTVNYVSGSIDTSSSYEDLNIPVEKTIYSPRVKEGITVDSVRMK